ncbi:MAG: hydrogenase expression/formation protein HypE [Bdellovibrio sp.]
MKIESIHGNGGKSSADLIEQIFKPMLTSELLSPHDAAEIKLHSPNLIVTTDAHVIDPIIFPGGDIGKLSLCGVINDLLTRGGKPQYLTLNFILDSGLEIEKLKMILSSMKEILNTHQIKLLAADTKVVPARGTPGLMIASTLMGEPINQDFQFQKVTPEQKVYLNKSIAEHGLALLQEREKLPFKADLKSDCQSLYSEFALHFEQLSPISYLRDCTRGGVATILHELASQFSVSFQIEEEKIPLLPQVRSALTFLGLDPLEVANEGVMLILADRDWPAPKNWIEIGKVVEKDLVPLVVKTNIGGERIVTYPDSTRFPRIC